MSQIHYSTKQKILHILELWDKLDPRDRDVILRHANFKVNTRCDWKALNAKEVINLVEWFYL